MTCASLKTNQDELTLEYFNQREAEVFLVTDDEHGTAQFLGRLSPEQAEEWIRHLQAYVLHRKVPA